MRRISLSIAGSFYLSANSSAPNGVIPTKISPLSNLLWGEGDSKAKVLQTVRVVLLNTSGIKFFEVIRSQVSIGLLGTQDMVCDNEQTVRNGYHSFLFSEPTSEMMVLGGEIIVLGVRDDPNDLGKHRS